MRESKIRRRFRHKAGMTILIWFKQVYYISSDSTFLSPITCPIPPPHNSDTRVIEVSSFEFATLPQCPDVIQKTETKTCNVLLPESRNHWDIPVLSQEELSEAIRQYAFEFFVHRFIEVNLMVHHVWVSIDEKQCYHSGYSIQSWAGTCSVEIFPDLNGFQKRAEYLKWAWTPPMKNNWEYDILIAYFDFDFFLKDVVPFLEQFVEWFGQQITDQNIAEYLRYFIRKGAIAKLPIQYASSTHPRSVSKKILTEAQKHIKKPKIEVKKRKK